MTDSMTERLPEKVEVAIDEIECYCGNCTILGLPGLRVAIREMEMRAEAAERALAEERERRGHAQNCECGTQWTSHFAGATRQICDPRCAPPPAAEGGSDA